MPFGEIKSPEDTKSVWSKYGLKESPFFTTPTRLIGLLPIEKVFSGREDATKQLSKMIASSNSTRTLVVGDFGVGKTTFVNYIKWLFCIRKEKSRFITTSNEIKIQPEWDVVKFLSATLSAMYNSSLIFKWEEEGIFLKSLKKIEPFVTIKTQTSVHGSFAGFGGGYAPSKSIPSSISPEIYEGLLNEFFNELVEMGKQMIITYDNMENIKLDQLADFFRTIKDYIQIRGLHTLFIGPPPSLSSIGKHSQVSDVFTPPIILGSLTEKNVLEILKRRCEELKLQGGNYIQPYDESTVVDIYKHLNNIRFTFKVLEDTTIYTESGAPCKITITDIKAVQEKEKKEILSKLSKPQTKIISTLMGLNEKINLGKLSRLTKIGSTNLKNPLTELESKGLITITTSEEDKRIKYVRLSDNSYLRLFYTSEEVKKTT